MEGWNRYAKAFQAWRAVLSLVEAVRERLPAPASSSNAALGPTFYFALLLRRRLRVLVLWRTRPLEV
jgi:hypothetical protein